VSPRSDAARRLFRGHGLTGARLGCRKCPPFRWELGQAQRR